MSTAPIRTRLQRYGRLLIGIRILFLSTSLCLLSKSHAHRAEEGQIWVTRGPFVFGTQNELKLIENSNQRIGLELTVTGDVNERGSIEISMRYLNKIYARKADDYFLVEVIDRIQMESGYRWWLKPNFSFGLFLATGYSMGDAEILRSSDPRPEAGFRTTAHDAAEYGISTSFLYDHPLSQNSYLVVDGRYFISTTRAGSEDANTFSLLLAYKSLFQRKFKP